MPGKTSDLTAGEARLVFSALATTGSVTKITLSRPRTSDAPPRVGGRVFCGREGLMIQWERQARDGKVFHQNLPLEEGAGDFIRMLTDEYRQANIRAGDGDHEVLSARPGDMRWTTRPSGNTAAPEAPAHDRAKSLAYPEGHPTPFLAALGIMDARGKVYPKAYDKYRQINKFVEIFEPVARRLPDGDALAVADLCCGKGYLTLALYDTLINRLGRPARVWGIDRKPDVVAGAQEAARACGYDGLSFVVGDIDGWIPPSPVDAVVSLHACDTATDVALAHACRWGARAILSSPCCHKEFAPQLCADADPLLLGHPILRQRYAEMLTDAARAETLRLLGYDVTVMEFVEMAHTQKNLLLRAERSGRSPKGLGALRTALAARGVTRAAFLDLLDEPKR